MSDKQTVELTDEELQGAKVDFVAQAMPPQPDMQIFKFLWISLSVLAAGCAPVDHHQDSHHTRQAHPTAQQRALIGS